MDGVRLHQAELEEGFGAVIPLWTFYLAAALGLVGGFLWGWSYGVGWAMRKLGDD